MISDNRIFEETVPTENWGCRLMSKEKLEYGKQPMPPQPGPWEALVAPKYTGLCGSDMHLYLHAKLYGSTKDVKPHILGHECSGIVVSVGSSVRGLQVGDKVALEPGEACYRCSFCKTGAYNHCEHMKFASAFEVDGTLQSFYLLPADLCYKLPSNIPLPQAAMIEPLAVAVNAVSRIAKIRAGENVAVFGTGPVGILIIAVAKAFGARRIIAVDVQQSRLDFVRGYAAVDTVLSSPRHEGEANPEYSQRQAKEISSNFGLNPFDSTGIDVAFECSGQEVCAQQAIHILKRRGRYIQVGNSNGVQAIPITLIGWYELTVKGSYRYGPGMYEKAIDLASRGLVDLKPLITHQFPFKDADEAFQTAKKGTSPDGKTAIKVVVQSHTGQSEVEAH